MRTAFKLLTLKFHICVTSEFAVFKEQCLEYLNINVWIWYKLNLFENATVLSFHRKFQQNWQTQDGGPLLVPRMIPFPHLLTCASVASLSESTL